MSYFTAPPSRAATHPRLRAVATVMQSNTSAIVTLKSSGIDRPKLLDGKKYASYGARYEGRIVQQLIKVRPRVYRFWWPAGTIISIISMYTRCRHRSACGAYCANLHCAHTPLPLQNDGGSGQYDEIVEPMLSLWDSVVSGKYDSTWVFMGWEGIEAQQKGIDLNVFMLQDFNVPYGEGPMIIALDSECKAGSDAAKVIAAAAKGYQWAVEHPEEAGEG